MRAICSDHLLDVVIFTGLWLFLAHQSAENADALLRPILTAELAGSEASGTAVSMRLAFLHLAECLIIKGIELAKDEAWPASASGSRPVEVAICGRHVYDGCQCVHGLASASSCRGSLRLLVEECYSTERAMS